MRFAAVIRPKQPAPVHAPGPIHRRVPVELAPRTQPVTLRPQEVPTDLDQRVRLVGEW
jgi:hypothetical protein